MHYIRIAGPRLLFLFVFLSGIWLSNSEKPLNPIILTIHKLLSLATVVLLVITMNQIHQVAKLSAFELIACMVTGVFFLSAIISGGLLSTGKPVASAILTLHQITSVLTVLSTATILVKFRWYR